MTHLELSRCAIILLAASSTLFAQTTDAPNVSQIVESSIAATQRSWQGRLQYTYVERDADRRLDSEGHVKSEEVDVSRTILVHGVPFEQHLEHNGKPLSAEAERKQQEKLDKFKRETPEQRAEHMRKEQEETLSIVREIPKAFDFQLLGEEIVNGRTAYVLQATPHPGYQAQGTYGKMFSKLEGKLWVDKQDFGWIKADGNVIQPFSLGLFLVRVQRGSHLTMEQIHIEEGTWVPQHIEIRAAAKIFFIKSLVIDRVLSYSEYKRLEAAAAPASSSSDRRPDVNWNTSTTTAVTSKSFSTFGVGVRTLSLQGTGCRDDPEQENNTFVPKPGLGILGSPLLFIAQTRKIVEKFFARDCQESLSEAGPSSSTVCGPLVK